MESKEFDDIIKSKLNNLAEVPDARAWDLFTLAALQKGEEEIFDDKSTDVLVKDALSNFKIDYDANTWDTLVDKMDKKEEDPVLLQRKFDREISNSLKSVTRKYDNGSWPKLAARIEQEEKYLRHYYRAKFIEACVFIFLILSLVRLGETGKLKLPLDEKENISETIPDQNVEIKASLSPASVENTDIDQIQSPLKYPKGKSRLSNIIAEVGKNLSENTKYLHQILVTGLQNNADSETNEVIESNKKSDPNSQAISILENNIQPLMNESSNNQNLDQAIASVSQAHAKSLLMQNKLAEVNNVMNEVNVPKRHFISGS